MIFLLITITSQSTQKDNSVTLSLIAIMPQIIHKRVISPVNISNSMALKNSNKIKHTKGVCKF